MRVEFLYWEECPSHEEALARLKAVLAEEGCEATVEVIRVETEEQAEALRFPGSPTIRFDGKDIVPVPEGTRFSLTCRVYHLEDGRVSPLPSKEMIRRAFKEALASKTTERRSL
ncbi:MAG: DUF2703 domain-containing protein [Armatimonadota bacterium]|nr:DUF2703 domain-containing protein [Armatimonadota bacterium]MDR7434347.1 DUF2703 domain-containing protein [Armatimonadota bacterium]